jgi:hypothetical protein
MARLRRRQFVTAENADDILYDDDDVDDNYAVSLYDIEFATGRLGIRFETNFYGKHAVVKSIDDGGQSCEMKCVIQPGHIVVAVNGHDVSALAFDTVY